MDFFDGKSAFLQDLDLLHLHDKPFPEEVWNINGKQPEIRDAWNMNGGQPETHEDWDVNGEQAGTEENIVEQAEEPSKGNNQEGKYKVPDKPQVPVFPMTNCGNMHSEPPAVFHEKEVVTDATRCRQLVHLLKRELMVGMAGEGIHVGAEGPLTLLQIGTFSGRVYVFDLLMNKDLFNKGGLKQILEADNIIKVAHSCCKLSAALYYQFAVRLRNVFDTQIGHQVIEEDRGRRLPNRLSLSEVCQRYSENPHPYDWRSDIKDMWVAKIGDYWAQRPLSEEMIEYAAGDVMALIPDVYREQQEYLDEHGLHRKFQALVEEEILVETNMVVKQIKGERIEKTVVQILNEIEEKYGENEKFFEAMNEDEINAIELVPFEEVEKMSAKLKKFKKELIMDDLDEIGIDIRLQQEQIAARPNLDEELRNYENLNDVDIRDKSEEIRKNLHSAILSDIGRRYSGMTSPHIMSETEREALRTLDPLSESDERFDSAVLAQYWLLVDYDIEQALFNLKYGFNDFKVSESFIGKLYLYYDGDFPDGLKQKCKLLLRLLKRGVEARNIQRPSDSFKINKDRKVTFEILESGH